MEISFLFWVACFRLVEVQSRSRAVVVLCRVDVEMGRDGLYLGKIFYRLIYRLIGTLQPNLTLLV